MVNMRIFTESAHVLSSRFDRSLVEPVKYEASPLRLQDQATEVILTLGQAFEVAYQMALRDKLGGQAIRSQSANQLTTLAGTSKSSVPAKMSVSPDSAPDPGSAEHIGPGFNSTSNPPKLKSRSKSIANPSGHAQVNPNPQDGNSNSNGSGTATGTGTTNCTNSATSPSTNSISSSNSSSTANQATKLLVTHGRSHSVNDIKVNGNQLKLVPAPVDDIGIGSMRDMKPGSRAPIALSEEL